MRRLVASWVLCAATLSAEDWRSAVASSFRDLANPYARDRRTLAAGRKLYRDYCADCHAAHGSGTRFGPPLRTRTVATAKPGELLWLLRSGTTDRRMPSFSFLNDKDQWAIVSFVRELR